MKLLSKLLLNIKDSLGIELDSDIARDILDGRIKDLQHGADLHTKGIKDTFKHRIAALKNEAICRIAGESPTGYSQGQSLHNRMWTSRISVKKLLMVGHRESAVILAESTYYKAARHHFFDVAADMAAILSRHYSHFMADQGTADIYHDRYLSAREEDQNATMAMYYAARYLSKIRKVKTKTTSDVSSLEKDVATIGVYSKSSSSYKFWWSYLRLQIFLHEAKCEWEEMFAVATEGYQYFENLFFDHSSGKLAMISYQLLALIGLKRYEEAAGYIQVVQDNKGAFDSWRLCQLYLMRVFLNLKDPVRVCTIYDAYFSKRSDFVEIDEMAQIYHIYALLMMGQADVKFEKNFIRDKHVMNAAVRIAKGWSAYLTDPSDIPVQTYERYLGRYFKKDTRTSIFLKMICALPLRGYEQERFERRIGGLKVKLATCEVDPIEAEIIDYDRLWGIMLNVNQELILKENKKA